MSLVNDMLRDLELRDSGGAKGKSPVVPQASGHRAGGGRRAIPVLAGLGVIAFFAVMAAGLRQPLPETDSANRPLDKPDSPPEMATGKKADAEDDRVSEAVSGVAPTVLTPAVPSAGREPIDRQLEKKTVVADDTAAVAVSDRHAVQVQPSFNQRDRQVAREARDLIEQQRLEEAQRALSGFIEQSPQSQHALYVLFQLRLRQGLLADAEQLLSVSRHLPGYRLAHMAAQVFFARGNLEAAIATMEARQPAYRQAPDYYRYLAGLYHRAGRYREAVAGYRRLLADNNTEGAYWLGLAVSLDALRDRRGALQAFRYANRFSAADAQTQPYIKQRIAALSG